MLTRDAGRGPKTLGMTHLPAFVRAFARRGPVLAAASLAALALSGCGSNDLNGSGPHAGPGGSADSKMVAASSSTEQAVFAAMLDRFARSCPSTDEATPGPTGKNASEPTRTKPTDGPVGQQSLAPGEVPPTEPIEPGAPTGPASELNGRDWCASVQHEQRIIEALQNVSDPTPAKVREVLNSLGYIDERIHGLKQDGEATRFYLDLRESGGRLCEAGRAAGAVTDMNVCAIPATGAFAQVGVVSRRGDGFDTTGYSSGR